LDKILKKKFATKIFCSIYCLDGFTEFFVKTFLNAENVEIFGKILKTILEIYRMHFATNIASTFPENNSHFQVPIVPISENHSNRTEFEHAPKTT